MTKDKIISLLPYATPFLFVDTLEQVDEQGCVGTYTFPPDSWFYKGHFVNNPVTPGVILTETMAQIGLVCLGIFLVKDNIEQETEMPKLAMVANETEFFIPVFPGEKVKVISKKVYFRFGKLKCLVEMRNEQDAIVCKGIISGMTVND